MPSAGFADWNELFDAFRQIGGVAENITVASRNGARGLFAAEPALPHRLAAPPHVLVPLKDVELRDGALSLVPDSRCSPAVREFFERYHGFTSWSGGGEAQTAADMRQMSGLPAIVRFALKKELDFGVTEGDPSPQDVLERFLRQRVITVNDEDVLMPVLELVNHSSQGVGFDIKNGGVSIAGKAAGEILVRYKTADSWTMFRHYGFPSLERWAFSQTFEVSPRNGSGLIRVRKKTGERVILPNTLLAPIVKKDGPVLDISFLTLGDRADPASPLRVFNAHVKKHFNINAAEFFESLTHINRKKFLSVLAACENQDGEALHCLRKVCRLQLETLNSSFMGAWI